MATLTMPSWIALTHRDLAADRMVGGLSTLRSTRDSAEFADLMIAARPRIAILVIPPAGDVDLMGAVRERRRRPSLRVVVLCPTDAIEARLDALRAGADEAHPESIDPTELEARLRLLEERARARHESILSISPDTELDLIAHEVRRSGELVHLRPKEFQLIAMLAAHPGRVYTRRQLLDRVWGHDHDGDPRTIDVHVRWLRSKLEPRPDVPIHLVTVRGVGYRLDPDPR